MPRLLLAACACILLLSAPAARAADQPPPARAAEPVPPAQPPHHTYEEAKRFVDDAVAYLKKVGPDKAFAAFNDPRGKWVKGDLYIFVFDQKGVYRATGWKPERTGVNAWKMKDASGSLLVVQEIIKKANRDGSGLVDYLWMNPGTAKLENKTSYVVKVDEYVVGAGFYHR
ncbi:MAG: cache domain-containing protein [Solirubrobacterales bacterium]